MPRLRQHGAGRRNAAAHRDAGLCQANGRRHAAGLDEASYVTGRRAAVPLGWDRSDNRVHKGRLPGGCVPLRCLCSLSLGARGGRGEKRAALPESCHWICCTRCTHCPPHTLHFLFTALAAHISRAALAAHTALTAHCTRCPLHSLHSLPRHNLTQIIKRRTTRLGSSVRSRAWQMQTTGASVLQQWLKPITLLLACAAQIISLLVMSQILKSARHLDRRHVQPLRGGTFHFEPPYVCMHGAVVCLCGSTRAARGRPF